jgi:hypothetical protein
VVAKGAIPPGWWGKRSGKPPPANGAGRVGSGWDNAAEGRAWTALGTVILADSWARAWGQDKARTGGSLAQG